MLRRLEVPSKPKPIAGIEADSVKHKHGVQARGTQTRKLCAEVSVLQDRGIGLAGLTVEKLAKGARDRTTVDKTAHRHKGTALLSSISR